MFQVEILAMLNPSFGALVHYGALLSLLKYKCHVVMKMFSLRNQSISESFVLEKLTGNGAITYPQGPNRIFSI